MMIFFKKVPQHIQLALQRLETSIELSDIAVAYQVIAYHHQPSIKQLGCLLDTYLASLSFNEIVKLGLQWKRYTSMEWSISWQNVNIQHCQMYRSLMILGVFHCNGYFREKCLRKLALMPHSLPFVIYCHKDHVKVIQQTAAQLFDECLSQASRDDVLKSIVAIDRVERSFHHESSFYQQTKDKYFQKFHALVAQTSADIFLHYDDCVRKCLYRYASFQSDTLVSLIHQEKSSFHQRLLINQYFSDPHLTLQQVQPFLHHRSLLIRKEAIYRYYQIYQGIWEGMESYLLDPSFAIRDFVRFLLEKYRHFDCRCYYMNHCENPISILGIGECGQQQDIAYVQSFLMSSDEKVTKMALQSLGLLMQEKASEIFWQYVLDQRIAVSHMAYGQIMKYHIHYHANRVYQAFVEAKYPHVQRYLLHMLYHEDSWERLPYLLMMYHHDDAHERQWIHQCIQKRDYYQRVSSDLRKKIVDVLNDPLYQIPQDVIEEIMFELKFKH